jgi:hypothetical protein
VVEIRDPKDPAALDHPELQITYRVRLPSAEGSLWLETAVDGAKVTAEDERLVDEGDQRVGNLHLTVPQRNSVVSVIAYNDKGASVPALLHVQWRGPQVDEKLTLYVLAIGISTYKDQELNLRYAAKDAADFVAEAEAQEGGLYGKVVVHPPQGSLRDGQATKDAILDELDWITRAVTTPTMSRWCFCPATGLPHRTDTIDSYHTTTTRVGSSARQSPTRNSRII